MNIINYMYFINILTVGKAAIYIFWTPPPIIFLGINLTDDSQEYHHGRKTLQSYPTYNMVMYPPPWNCLLVINIILLKICIGLITIFHNTSL